MDRIDVRKRILNGLLAAYIIFVFIILLFVFSQGIQWINNPFVGRFLEPSFIFSNAPVEVSNVSPLVLPNNTSDYQLIAINDVMIGKDSTYLDILRSAAGSGEINLTLKDSTGELISLSQKIQSFQLKDQLYYFYFPLFLGWLFLMIALNGFKNRILRNGQAGIIIFSGAAAVVLSGSFDLISTHQIYPLWIIFMALIGAGFFNFAFQQLPATRFVNQIIGLVYFAALSDAFYTWFTPYGITNPIRFADYIQWVLLLDGFLLFAGIIILIFSIYLSKVPQQKQQKMFYLGASLLSLSPIFTWLLVNSFINRLQISYAWLIPVLIFPLAVFLLDVKTNKFNGKRLGEKIILYGLLGFLITLGYGFIISGVSLLFFNAQSKQNPIVSGFIVFGLALIFLPVKNYLQKQLSEGKSLVSRNFESKLNVFNNDLTRLTSLNDIINLLRLDIQGNVQAQFIHIFLYDSNQNVFSATQSGLYPSSDLIFHSDSALPLFLGKVTDSHYFTNFTQVPHSLKEDLPKIRILAARLFIPIHGQNQLLGWVAMSNRLDGETYNADELVYLNAIVQQATLAIERSMVINTLQRRINELNIITHAEQGMNYTLQITDLFEFIYNQINLLLNPDFFQIILRESNSNIYTRIFSVIEGERDYKNENVVVDIERSLLGGVVNDGKAVNISDIHQEYQERGIDPISENITSALLVPMNSGAETIGVLLIGYKYEGQHTSYDQVNLVQVLADQFAGALIKARLYHESQLRAAQLASLNTLTQQLTATLELKPLYENILNIAMKLVNCRGGALILIDPLAGDLEYKTCEGIYNKALKGRHFPISSGIAGRAISNSKPEVIYKFSQSDFIGPTENITSEKIHSVLVIPLISNGESIGAIELVERKDELPFSLNDQEILQAFASQVSIALENAKLYASTDQALANRIEELSVMQRIDRELNSSLNLQRALDITLHWAIRQSRATAGIIGQVFGDEIHLDVYEGYDTEILNPYLGKNLDLTFMDAQKAFESGKPIQKLLNENDVRLNPEAGLQVIIPIRRKEQWLAFFLLEFKQKEPIDETIIEFLIRLSEHASFALLNAQLFSQIQQANLAKSEFVTLVAHELKNPMTSIKGYTELLSGKAVGEINESQSNFLQTIRSNIDRINSLISDLDDLSKIESGRLRMDFKSVKLDDVLDDVLLSNRRMIEEKQQKLTVEISPDLPPVWVDPVRLGQVFINLVSNANKYSAAGNEIYIGAQLANTERDDETKPAMVHAWVKDYGIGIQPEDQKKIFQKFYRSEDPKAREVNGTGLGLNISNSMIELQGGKIWFESEFRKGTTFHLLIPVAGN